MQGENMVSYVIRKRGAFQSRDKIAQVVANSGKLDYYQAQQFVRQIEDKYARKIALRQLPMTLALGIPGVILGLFLAGTLAVSLYYGRFRIGTIYYGLFGLALLAGSTMGVWSVIRHIIRG